MGMLQNLTGWHAIIILALVLLLFGAAKLPALAKSVGQSMKIFKTEMKDAAAPATTADTAALSTAAPSTAAQRTAAPSTAASDTAVQAPATALAGDGR